MLSECPFEKTFSTPATFQSSSTEATRWQLDFPKGMVGGLGNRNLALVHNKYMRWICSADEDKDFI